MSRLLLHNMKYNIMNFIHANEAVTTGYTLGFLDLIFYLSILLAILVVISKNPIISVLYLIGLFFNIACYLILLGMNFVGLSYLLVYVGAVSILFLFILMLINVRVSELTTESTNSIPLLLTISALFIYSIKQVMTMITLSMDNNNTLVNNLYNIFYYYSDMHNYINELKNITYVTSSMWDGYISETTHIASIGNIMYTSYSIWLLITSIILLLAMVGSIVITLKPENRLGGFVNIGANKKLNT